MPNTLVLPKNYVANLDEVYKLASVTSDLTCDATVVRAGANVGEVIYPQIEVSGAIMIVEQRSAWMLWMIRNLKNLLLQEVARN